MEIYIKKAVFIGENSPYNGKELDVIIHKGKVKDISEVGIITNVKPSIEGGMFSFGFFDLRCASNDPGFEHKEDFDSLSKAAAKGGFTGVTLLPETRPIVQTKEAIAYIKSKTRDSISDFFSLAAITTDFKGEELTEMIDLINAGAIGFCDGNHCISHSGVLSRALQYLKPHQGILFQHPEDKKLTQYGQMNEGITSTYLGLKGIPALAEEIIILRDIEILKYSGGRIHFSHISTAKSVEIIAQAQKEGLNVTCDVAVPNLCFTDEKLSSFDSNFKLNPPLRTESDRQALWKGLENGTISAIVSDHAPQDEESKFLEFDMADFGMAQLETAFSNLLEHKPKEFELSKLIAKISTEPRNILNLPKVQFEIGHKAELTFFDTTKTWVYHKKDSKTKAYNSPFYESEMQGVINGVINGEKMIFF